LEPNESEGRNDCRRVLFLRLQDRLSQSIASGITKTGVNVEMIDLRSAEPQEVQELISRCAGIVIGMPPTTARTAATAQTIISTVLAAAKEKQVVGIFESGGGDDEPVDPLLSNLEAWA